MTIDLDSMSADDAVAMAEHAAGGDEDDMTTDEPTPSAKRAVVEDAPADDMEDREAFADKLDHMDGDALRAMYAEVYGEPRKVAARNDKLDRLRAAIMAKRFPKVAKPTPVLSAMTKQTPKPHKKAEKPAKVAKAKPAKTKVEASTKPAKAEKPKAEPKTPAPKAEKPKKEAKPKAEKPAKTPKPAKEGVTPHGGWRHDMTAKIEESTLNPREVKVLEALRSAKGAGAEGLSVGEMAKLCFSGLRKAEGTYEGGGEKAEKNSMKPAYRAVLNSLRKLVAGQYAEKCARGVYRVKGKK